MTTTVWRCEPRSHGRNKASSPLPGRWPSVAVPHRSSSPASRPCGHSTSFRRRASSFVHGVCSRRRCYWRRCWASERGACGAQRSARARVAAPWLRLLLRRRVRCDSRCACSAMCALGGCVRASVGCKEGGGSTCPCCERGVALLRDWRACAPPPVSVRRILLMSQADCCGHVSAGWRAGDAGKHGGFVYRQTVPLLSGRPPHASCALDTFVRSAAPPPSSGDRA